MLVQNYELPSSCAHLVRIAENPNVLSVEGLGELKPPALYIWRGALKDPAIDSEMKRADWPLQILHSLPAASGWNWELKSSAHANNVTQWSEIIDLATAACGIRDKSSGNVTVTLPLRAYEEKSAVIGTSRWWREQHSRLSLSSPLAASFHLKLQEMLNQADEAGASLSVEQISLIIAKDESDSIATLTPTLHSDSYYGPRETALCSLVERESSQYGGTLFAPTVTMDKLERYRPIDLPKMLDLLSDEPIVEASSGDVVLYGGMIGHDGKTCASNGVPHISPDMPGRSSRLVILMRNSRQTAVR